MDTEKKGTLQALVSGLKNCPHCGKWPRIVGKNGAVIVFCPAGCVSAAGGSLRTAATAWNMDVKESA